MKHCGWQIINKKIFGYMSKRYSGKSFKDSSVMKKPKLSLKEKRKIKREKRKKKNWKINYYYFLKQLYFVWFW